jgi:hypothetical protein
MKIPFWLRLYFVFVLLQALLVASALIWPELITLVMPWDPKTQLNARFIGALYMFGAFSALFGIFAKRYAEVRITIYQVAFLTGALLLLTIPHFGELFTAGNFPYKWTIFYTIDPIVSILILWVMRGRDPGPRGVSRLWPTFALYTLAIAIIGFALLFLSQQAVNLWPWSLSSLPDGLGVIIGQVYSIFILAYAVGGLLAIFEPRWAGVWIYCAANFGMWVLIAGVSLYHRDRFSGGPSTWLWGILCLLGVVLFGLALLQQPRDPSEIGVHHE